MASIFELYPTHIIQSVLSAADRTGASVYLVGGTVRDWIMGRSSQDLDLTIASGAAHFCDQLITELGGGTYVSLAGRDGEDAGRVVWKVFTIDVSSFRAGALTLEQDLAKRDFTVNCMAVDLLKAVKTQSPDVEVFDPQGGQAAIINSSLICCEGAFDDDPLRMLRGYRLQATHGLLMEKDTLSKVKNKKALINRVSKERVQYELNLIMHASSGASQIEGMAANGLLFELFSELKAGEGVEQPDFHHLDVLHHGLEALCRMEEIINYPEGYFSVYLDEIKGYLQLENIVPQLKWAALFHDLGKPSVKAGGDSGKRVSFHNHDQVGRDIFNKIADRFRWSNESTAVVGDLISLHMYPFHLGNLLREGELSKRAIARLARRAEEKLIGLFLLAMSDSLASQGELKPENMEGELDRLFKIVYSTYLESIKPVVTGPKLLTGDDLIKQFKLEPGPIFKEILNELELAVIEGQVIDREGALNWVEKYLLSKPGE